MRWLKYDNLTETLEKNIILQPCKHKDISKMKKTIIYALVTIVTIAFASCGPKESKQFTEQKESAEKISEMISSAKDCDDLSMAALGLLALAFDEDEYAEKEKMTAEESEKFEQITNELIEQLENKSDELRCEEEIEEESDLDIEMEEEEIAE